MEGAQMAQGTMTTGRQVSGWVTGLVLFAGVIMIMVGVYQAIVGVAALADDQFYVVTSAYAFRVDVTAWGWIHLFLGIFVAAAGWAVIAGSTWGRVVGVAMALLSAIANFFFIPYYPVWSLLIIILDVFVIWALCVYGRRSTADDSYLG
jgi:hypothetical protein